MGTSGSASFQISKNWLYAWRAPFRSPLWAFARPSCKFASAPTTKFRTTPRWSISFWNSPTASDGLPALRYASPRTYAGYSVPLRCESGSGTPNSYLRAVLSRSIAAALSLRLNAIEARITGNQKFWIGVLRGRLRVSSLTSAVARSISPDLASASAARTRTLWDEASLNAVVASSRAADTRPTSASFRAAFNK